MHVIIGFLSLLLAAPSFEGKWTAEAPGLTGKLVMQLELKADGTLELSATDKDGKSVAKEPGKWKKTGDKTIEVIIDKTSANPGKGELIDDKTLEINDSVTNQKIKFTRQ